MKELALKYGCNPNQKPSRIFMEEGELPIEVLNGRPGYINFLDAFNSWQLVKELKNVMWDETGHRLPNTVAISPQKLAEAAGFTIPDNRKFIAVTGGGMEGVGKEHFFSSEKLTTLLTLFKYYGEFENALTMMQAMFNVGGKGHSCGIYSFDDDHIHRLGMCAPVSRIMVRQPNNRGNSGSSTNGMPPTSSMGCGTWGGNIVSENICLKHYMNTTWVARPLPEDMPSNEELFGEFNKPDMEAVRAR